MMTVNPKAGILHYSNTFEKRSLPRLGVTLPGDPMAIGRVVNLHHPAGRYVVGSCSAEGADMRLEGFPWVELSIVEAGELHLRGEGFELTLLPGDCFVIPRGASLHWRHEGQLKRVFMAFLALEPGAGMPRTPIKVDLAQPLAPCEPPAASVLLTPAPKAWSQTLFMADNLRIGLWQCEPYARRQVEPGYSELMFILKGSVTLTTENGERYPVQAGETIIVPQGATNAWTSEDLVRKVFCILS